MFDVLWQPLKFPFFDLVNFNNWRKRANFSPFNSVNIELTLRYIYFESLVGSLPVQSQSINHWAVLFSVSGGDSGWKPVNMDQLEAEAHAAAKKQVMHMLQQPGQLEKVIISGGNQSALSMPFIYTITFLGWTVSATRIAKESFCRSISQNCNAEPAWWSPCWFRSTPASISCYTGC